MSRFLLVLSVGTMVRLWVLQMVRISCLNLSSSVWSGVGWWVFSVRMMSSLACCSGCSAVGSGQVGSLFFSFWNGINLCSPSVVWGFGVGGGRVLGCWRKGIVWPLSLFYGTGGGSGYVWRAVKHCVGIAICCTTNNSIHTMASAQNTIGASNIPSFGVCTLLAPKSSH